MRSLAVERGRDSIRVNALLPCIVAGERQQRVLAAKAEAVWCSRRSKRVRLPACRDRATLNKSLAARSALFWAVCGVANPRHSWAMAVVCAWQPIPNQGAHTREDLFSMAIGFFKRPFSFPMAPRNTTEHDTWRA